MTEADFSDTERELCRIPHVRAARIVSGPDGRPAEVHVLATPGKQPKQVVRDVQSVALASVGLMLDHRIVSVVQLEDAVPTAAVRPAEAPPEAAPADEAQPEAVDVEPAPEVDRSAEEPAEEPAPEPAWSSEPIEGADRGPSMPVGEPPSEESERQPVAGDTLVDLDLVEAEGGTVDLMEPGPHRAVVDTVIVTRQDVRCSVNVTLRTGETTLSAEVSGPAASRATLRLVAEATLDALKQSTPRAGRLAVETAVVTAVGERSVALTTLVMVDGDHEELLSGSAPVHHGRIHEAVARSVLDATNRRLQRS